MVMATEHQGTKVNVRVVRRTLAVAVAYCALAACSSPEWSAPEPVQRDSAGVQIVENPARLAQALVPWSLDTVPEVDIGVAEGDPAYQLFRVTGAAQLPDGRIVIVNAGSQEVRFFDADGLFQKSVGGRGGGPGEYQFPQLIPATRFDTIWIYDIGGRITLLDQNGEILDTFSPSTQIPQPVGIVGGKVVTALGSARAGPNTPEGMVSNDMTYEAIDIQSAVRDTLIEVEGIDLFLWNANGRVGFTSVPLDAAPSATVAGEYLFVTPGEPAEILVLDASGELRRIYRIEGQRESVPPAMFERAMEIRISQARTESDGVELRRRFGRMAAPEAMPVFQNLLVDEAGFLWLEAFRLEAASRREWIIVDPSGRVLGRIETPTGVAIRQIGSDFILGIKRDESDVEHVVRHRLTRSF